MEKEELMVETLEEVTPETTGGNRKNFKMVIIGATAGVLGLLLACRKKISQKLEENAIRKLNKKGYTVIKQEEPAVENSEDDVFDLEN